MFFRLVPASSIDAADSLRASPSRLPDFSCSSRLSLAVALKSGCYLYTAYLSCARGWSAFHVNCVKVYSYPALASNGASHCCGSISVELAATYSTGTLLCPLCGFCFVCYSYTPLLLGRTSASLSGNVYLDAFPTMHCRDSCPHLANSGGASSWLRW